MGGGMSIEQQNDQSIRSSINQEIMTRCVLSYQATSNVSMTLKGGTANNVTIGNSIVSNDSSCALKSSLNSTVINNLKSQQGATQFDVPGIFTVLSDLTGSRDDINQNNSQKIANQATQLINSLCQDNKLATKNVNITAIDENINNLNVNNLIGSNKFNCILENTSSYYNQNSESNTQKATQVRIDSMIFIVLIIAVSIVAIEAIKYGFKKNNNNNNNNTINKINPQEKELNELGEKIITGGNNTSAKKNANIFNAVQKKGIRRVQ